MAKTVGLSRKITLKWLNKMVELAEENLPEAECKNKLNEYLSFEIESPTNLRKTREILMRIWYYPNEEDAVVSRDAALSLLRKYPDDALAIHWCRMLMLYPVFVDLSKFIGRISEFSDEIVLGQLKKKLYDEWGERTTLYHSTDKIMSTMKEMGVINNQTVGRYTIIKHKVSRPEIIHFMVRTAMLVDGKSYYTLSEINAFEFLFPFEYKMSKEGLMTDENFVVTNFGGEISVALKNV